MPFFGVCASVQQQHEIFFSLSTPPPFFLFLSLSHHILPIAAYRWDFSSLCCLWLNAWNVASLMTAQFCNETPLRFTAARLFLEMHCSEGVRLHVLSILHIGFEDAYHSKSVTTNRIAATICLRSPGRKMLVTNCIKSSSRKQFFFQLKNAHNWAGWCSATTEFWDSALEG